MGKAMGLLALMGTAVNQAVSFVIFSFLDLLDFVLCFVYRVADFLMEAHWKPCYCSPTKEALTIGGGGGGKILVSEKGESRIVHLSSTTLQLEEISDTLYSRASSISEASKFAVREFQRLKGGHRSCVAGAATSAAVSAAATVVQSKAKRRRARSRVTVNSTIIEMLQGKMGGPGKVVPRWSDCDCGTCAAWNFTAKESLFVKAQIPKGKVKEDVLFIHGFISSSVFWTETLFPNFSSAVKSSYRLIAIDLLGFGRSPKPDDSLYTLREHLDMIEKSVVEPYQLKSFHIVAHSLGCILALALAAKHPGAVKSLTLLSPPYFPIPKGEEPAQYVLRRIAPRRVWPPIAFGASLAGWYEHVSRTICLLICKNHRLWEFLAKVITRNRIRTYLCEGFCCHTHNAAWHTLHNIICGAASKIDGYLDAVQSQLDCSVALFHGSNDDLVPVECSYNMQSRLPGASLKVLDKMDHITIVVGRQVAFARELEQIWRKSTG